MARLIGPDDHSLDLTVLHYEFDLSRLRDNSDVAPNDWDANWLVMRIAPQAGALRWSVTRAVFLTWDLFRLIRWLEAVADDGPSEQAAFVVMEPWFQLEPCGPTQAHDIRATFGEQFLPSSISEHTRISITFKPGKDGIRRFASELRDELQRFPIVPVEPNGPARHWLDTCGEPTSKP